jgi:tetratricopeptide (TPR) repeat protein
MYIRTPKKYRGAQRRSVFSCGRFLMILLLLGLIALGVGIYQMQDVLRPYVLVAWETAAVEADTWRTTQFAPTAAPTTDPSRTLIDADNNWTQGRISIALEAYRNVIHVVPNNVQVYSRMTFGYLTRGDLVNAVRYAENTVTADPFSAEAWSTRALVYAWEDNAAQSIASAQQALALDPDNATAMAYLAYAYFESDLSDRAVLRANDAVQLDANRWEGYWVRAILRENVAPFDLAGALNDYETAYTLALEQNPAMAGVIAYGWSRVLQHPDYGQTEASLGVLNTALALDPDNVSVLYALGETYFRVIGDYAQAQDPLSDCTRVAPSNYDCWYMLGRTQERLGDQEAALASFEEAVRLGTPYARHYWWAANMEISVGSCNRATTYLETGYDMVNEGGLDAADEGDTLLIEAYNDRLTLCRVPIAIPTSAEATAEPTVEGE